MIEKLAAEIEKLVVEIENLAVEIAEASAGIEAPLVEAIALLLLVAETTLHARMIAIVVTVIGTGTSTIDDVHAAQLTAIVR